MITLYTSPGCQPCRLTKRLLQQHELSFQEVCLLANDDAKAKVKNLGYATAPVVLRETESGVESFSGFRPDRIAQWAEGIQ